MFKIKTRSNKSAALLALMSGALVAANTYLTFFEGKVSGAKELTEEAEKQFFAGVETKPDLPQDQRQEDLPPSADHGVKPDLPEDQE